MHADRAVHAVVGDDHDRVGAVLAGGGDLVAHHQRAAVAEERNYLRSRPAQCRGNCHRYAGPHCANHRGKKDLPLAEADVTVHKAAEISGVGRDCGVGRQVLVDLTDDCGEIYAVGGGLPFLGQQFAVDRVQPIDPAAALPGISRSATPQ